jgi:hypothetical protein
MSAATFVVPPDRDLVSRADAIVLATAVSSYSAPTADGGIETLTTLRTDEVIKGVVGQTFTVAEPGGEYGGRFMLISGVPRFTGGTKMLLMLARTGTDRWAVSELVLGKFTFREAANGSPRILERDADEISGWDPDLTPHREEARLADRFLDFVRAESKGRRAAADYFAPVTMSSSSRFAPATTSSTPTSTAVAAPAAVTGYSATSYTMVISGSSGSRWTVFPSPVTFYSGTTQEPGAPGGGSTAINAAFAAWDNDCGSNVNYVYGGTDNGTHTQGLHGVDGANTILFERDLSSWGIAPFSCSSGGYSGTLGLGGITNASGTNSVNGETFATTQEADVEMNRGIANCSLLFGNGDFNSAVAHEVGHTLGFRHADQDRASSGSCTSDPSLECSSSAIMKSFVSTGLNAALQPWDQHAVDAVYPGNVCAPTSTCTAPAITAQPQSVTISSGTTTTLTVTASGTSPLTYAWYLGTSGNTATYLGGGPSYTTGPGSTTQYWVRVSNACGTVNSNTVTVTVASSCTAPVITSQPQSVTTTPGGLVTLTVAASGSGSLAYTWYVGSSGDTTTPVGNGPSYTTGPASTKQYWVRVTNSCGSVNSATATVTVCSPPSITSQPQSVTIQPGTFTTLTVSASGSNLTYAWYLGTSGDTTTYLGGGPSYTTGPASTKQYWVRVSNACGSVASATATVTVCSAPTITSQPQSTTIRQGQFTTLTVGASGTNLTYAWYLGTSGDTTTYLGGGPSYTTGPASTKQYWVRVSSACGSIDSATATVTVTP